jgi:uncharacterized protein
VSEARLPTRAEALDILAAAGCSKRVIDHSKAVSKFSVKLAKAFQARGVDVDLQLVEIGGLLHDIGRSKTHTVDHGSIGGEVARSMRLPQSIVRVIERHVGGGIPKEEARRLGWLAKDYLPETWEEKIVCYADKRIEGLRIVSIGRAIRPYVASLGEKHPAIGRIMKLHDEIVATVGEL